MTDWSSAWEVFDAACELPASQRRQFVESALTDPAMASKVMGMLERLDAPISSDTPEPSLDSPADTEEEWPQLGKTVGRFVVTGCLGRGGMGEVYTARDPELNRTVALKFLSSGRIGSSGGVSRFIREAQAASGLNHPGIVTVYEVIRFGSNLAIAMELVDGKSMRALCGAPHQPAQVAGWGRQIAEALAVAHAHGIVHRDIKPENLMLRPDGYVKVLDFGLACDLDGNRTSMIGLPAGTLRYMSPEQVRGEPAMAPSDIFTLGIVLYELVAGAHPFAMESALETPYAITMQEPLAASSMNSAVPLELDALIFAMLRKNPAERPAAAAVAQRLAGAMTGKTEAISGRADRRKRFLAWVCAGAATLALAAAGWRWEIARRVPLAASPPPVAPMLRPVAFSDSSGNESQPAFSPDGRQLAYSWDDGSPGQQRAIYVKSIGSGEPRRLTSGGGDDYDAAWSPDGAQVAFLRASSSLEFCTFCVG